MVNNTTQVATHSMSCDLCRKVMEDDETGLFLIESQVGGHIACLRLYMSEMEMELT